MVALLTKQEAPFIRVDRSQKTPFYPTILSMGKPVRKSHARHTLFIDQADASYWLAANSLLDEEEYKEEISRAGLGLDLDVIAPIKEEEEKKDEEQDQNDFMPINFSNMYKNTSRPYSRQLPPLPLDVPDRSSPLCAPKPFRPNPTIALFSSPRPAPPAPLDSPQSQKVKSPTKPPNYPLPPVPSETGRGMLQPPIKLLTKSPSPNPSEHPGSSLLHQPSAFSYMTDYGASTTSVDSTISSPSPPSSPNIGAVIISSFPPPPQRTKDYDCRPCHSPPAIAGSDHVKERGGDIKPLPPTPPRYSKERMTEEDFRKQGELHAWLVSMVSAGCPRVLPSPSAFHHPECPFACRLEVPTHDCGCRTPTLHRLQPGKLKPSTSEPNLLEISAKSQTQLDEQRKELHDLKKEVYRMSDEMRRHAAKAVLANIPDRSSSNQAALKSTPTPSTPLQRRSRHIRLAEPGEKPMPHTPTGSILLPSPPRYVSSLDLATTRQRLGHLPNLLARPKPDLSPIVDFSASQRNDSPVGNGRSKMMISTVRSHNRDASNSRPSPPLMATRVYNRSPVGIPGHHRQTSSKSSNYSSDSNMSSSYTTSTNATSTESLILTPSRVKQQARAHMYSISERSEGKKRAVSPFARQVAPKQAYAAAVEPFPYQSRRQPFESNRGDLSQWTEEVEGRAL